MNKKRLVLCDRDAMYLERLLFFIESRESCPFEILGFTDIGNLQSHCQQFQEEIALLVVAESVYDMAVERVASCTLVLYEGLDVSVKEARKVNKFQQAREIYKAIIELCLEKEMELPGDFEERPAARVLGFYSPVKRAMQTSFALELGRDLASRYKVLYVSFEQYAGWNGLLCREGGKDLLDLLYYLKEEDERFVHRLGQIEQKQGMLSYIPPVYAGQNLVYVTTREWIALIEKLKHKGHFDFVLLDLSDNLQGVFEILRTCEQVFTMTLPDSPAKTKIEQYECLLKMYEYDDVLEKSKKRQMPTFETIPDKGEQWTKEEWMKVIRKVEVEDLRLRV